MAIQACTLEAPAESQPMNGGMEAAKSNKPIDAPSVSSDVMGFIERHRALFLTSPIWVAIVTIVLRSVSADFRHVSDFIFRSQ